MSKYQNNLIGTYFENYEELEVIGSGSYGSASLVRIKKTGELQVAKKIDLGKLSEKEKNSALREVQVLKSLDHPNIVQYKGSFIEKQWLIILMEYCEEGDLNYHIKKRKNGKKTQYFPEKMILNWLIQLLFALQHIHIKRILHRDIKTSNIFLTSNGTVKLGDFGVSKVLENTLDIASTLAGTPYYMSPEVCENKPYTFKSDVWALGCVLYELCTFKYAFDAKNILGLISKILQDQAGTIPNHYSKDLQNLIQKLLQKQLASRPIISEIINMNFIQQVMNDFITNGGKQSYCQVVGVKKVKQHSFQQQHLKYQDDDDEDEDQFNVHQQQILNSQSKFSIHENTSQVAKSIVSQNSDLSKYTIGDTIISQQSQVVQTPKDILRLKKEEEIKKRQLELSEAAANNAKINKSQSELRKVQNMHGTGSKWFEMEQAKQQKQQQQQQNYENTINYDKTLKTQSHFMPIDDDIMKRSLLSLKSKKANKNLVQQQIEKSSSEEYPDDFDYYEEDFEDYDSDDGNQTTIKEEIVGDEMDGRLTARQSEQDLQNVVEVYKNELMKAKCQEQDPNLQQITEENESITSSFYKTDEKFKPQVQMIEKLKESILQQLTQDVFNKAYQYMKHSLLNEISHKEVQQELIKIVGKRNMNACFNIDQLIYRESELYKNFGN